MPMPPDDLFTMPASFRAGLDAALSRPLLLEERALDPLRVSAGGLRPLALEERDDEEGGPAPEPFERDGDVAIVRVSGPLAQRAWSCWMFSGDGYDAIVERGRAALYDSGTRSLVLRLDSPGGEVAGCFDAVRQIRAMAADAGKPVVAYADEVACSAAYALACAAGEIVVPDTGIIGSVGVIMAVTSRAGELAQRGVSVALITSGAAKADGHPALPLSDAARERLQGDVNALARLFAAEVSHARPLTAEQVLALQARTFLGAEAVNAGLADRVGTCSTAIARAREMAATRPMRTPTGASALTPTRNTTMPDALLRAQLDALRASLAVETDAEVPAAVSTLKKLAEAGDAAVAEAAKLRAQLAERDARETARDRDAVLAKHRQRGALTPALEGDAEYMADLAPLPPAALDRVLAKLPSAAAPVRPRKVDAIDPGAVDASAGAVDASTREWQQHTGVSDEGVALALADDKRRAAQREAAADA